LFKRVIQFYSLCLCRAQSIFEGFTHIALCVKSTINEPDTQNRCSKCMAEAKGRKPLYPTTKVRGLYGLIL
jgi:hypothetical protein